MATGKSSRRKDLKETDCSPMFRGRRGAAGEGTRDKKVHGKITDWHEVNKRKRCEI